VLFHQRKKTEFDLCWEFSLLQVCCIKKIELLHQPNCHKQNHSCEARIETQKSFHYKTKHFCKKFQHESICDIWSYQVLNCISKQNGTETSHKSWLISDQIDQDVETSLKCQLKTFLNSQNRKLFIFTQYFGIWLLWEVGIYYIKHKDNLNSSLKLKHFR
jgi:hypothetical protein